MSTEPTAMHPGTFRYVELDIDESRASVRVKYELDGETFEELAHLPDADFTAAGTEAAAALYFLLAGVSYYKTRAPRHIDLGTLVTTPADRDFLRTYLLEGLGEFAWKNHLDLDALEIHGPNGTSTPRTGFDPGAVLIPFGGGLDSIVTVAELAPQAERAALFVAERPGARFAAIEASAALTGLEVLRAERSLDPKVLDSAAHGYLNGHVPVTGVLSALSVLRAVTSGFGAVVMSNERSASAPTLQGPRGPVNHQWSKGAAFEAGFRGLIARRLGDLEYFSWLRDRSELSIAESFARLEEFHPVFRSCNRNFHQNPEQRIEGWCGVCDKCLFINLALSPQLDPTQLSAIFGGAEPIDNPDLTPQLEILCGLSADPRPFECVGDEAECRQALHLAAARPDRAGDPILQGLAARLGEQRLIEEHEPTFIPERYATQP